MSELALSERPVVLFDFDGTVVDSGPCVMKLGAQVIENHGLPRPSREEMKIMVGPPLEEGFMAVAGVTHDEALVMTREYRELFDAVLGPEDYPVIDGMRELLDALAAKDRCMAVATSRFEVTAQRMAAEHGLTQFDAICGRIAGVRYSKAESIAAALEALGASPEEAVMVGDRHHDVDGAREFGIPCIGVYTGGAKPGEHEEAGAAAVCHSAHDIARVLGVEL